MSESGPLSADRPEVDREFRVDAPFDPAGDQPEAIEALARGYGEGADVQTLLGVTGSGKTNTVSWVIEEIQKPTLVLAHNKTLAAQLYEEFKSLFPDNAVEYFVSYYDYYQPEAYIEQTDTYIDKDMSINEEIDRLRHSATRSLLTRDDVIVVASVSAIYGLGDPKNYTDMSLRLEVGEQLDRDELLKRLVDLNYERNDVDFRQGTFRVRGDTVEVFPMYGRYAVRVEFWGDEIDRMLKLDPLEGEVKSSEPAVLVHPAEHYSIPEDQLEGAISEIEELMEARVKHFQRQGDLVAAQRIEERTTFDIEMLRETGHCSGIENYSVHLSDRKPGDSPYTLLDYFPDDFLTVVDESHVTLPQIKGQYAGDKSRKDSLVENGFRLPTAYDNRPLTFEEFEEKVGQALFVSATPGDYEREHSEQIVEQIVRPTHLVDPKVEVTEATGQVDDLMARIDERIDREERVLVTTLTKRMAEDLTEYLEEAGVDVAYMHDETDTLERHELIRSLRLGDIDVLVGINLLREGLDIPEVSLVAILDADQQGFLRSETTLVQTMGRAARNVNGEVVLYADEMTDAMEAAISETQRRRRIQQEFNEEHGHTPKTIEKEVGETNLPGSKTDTRGVSGDAPGDADEAAKQIAFLENRMQEAADNLEFELAADIRDRIQNLRREFDIDALDDGVAPEYSDEDDDGLAPPDEF
ncbi:excinuclease ABC subunit UvrB [Haloferax mediterranei ATCC 33500]|uniref:UvrABC system protein B n=1 Tax=Haloferax mediterranei (strain ATCC 33500 / DSM 1411 / JCM 8866 / NBRC 14739 / NCIMB 2177 / R-4) TaxID=523841 RepID=I3R0L1_HALMT|nr:excinuclease ABC subunit UvrB [Haloferax mediterranei]AFK17771.1 excinuclease ABC subunit B [Haloferax mediterranei ATCC 33500]AHZ22797.1 excinuclease ABC subunit B [Haloferax mediterranei ATCC 33500]EMA02957.1 excinuclease ABC subunit B [Haloferax mediterranei ATCC 33500]MDX5987860.1 excinuclease ABC subunit UvrB [Haloferax mediterranei ATCC 33500]QCQ74336.1 excinuclease ABC subunit UvrB [Haloferax mediterranei ATCC 33500]